MLYAYDPTHDMWHAQTVRAQNEREEVAAMASALRDDDARDDIMDALSDIARAHA